MPYRVRNFHRRFRRVQRPRGIRRSAKFIRRVARSTMRRMSERHMLAPVALSTSFSSLPNTWTEVDLCDSITCGYDISQRIGRKISISSFSLEGVLHGGQSGVVADDRYNTVRFVLGLWRHNTPCVTNAFTMDSLINKAGFSSTGGVSLVRKYRDFKVILTSPSPDTTGYMPALKKIKIFIKFRKPLVISFPSVSATSTQNTYFVLSMLSDSSLPPNPGFIAGSYTITWYDN